MNTKQKAMPLEVQFLHVNASYIRTKLSGRDPRADPTLMGECMEVSRRYQTALSNGHFGDSRLLRRQLQLEGMMDRGDYYLIDGEQFYAVQYGA